MLGFLKCRCPSPVSILQLAYKMAAASAVNSAPWEFGFVRRGSAFHPVTAATRDEVPAGASCRTLNIRTSNALTKAAAPPIINP